MKWFEVTSHLNLVLHPAFRGVDLEVHPFDVAGRVFLTHEGLEAPILETQVLAISAAKSWWLFIMQKKLVPRSVSCFLPQLGRLPNVNLHPQKDVRHRLQTCTPILVRWRLPFTASFRPPNEPSSVPSGASSAPPQIVSPPRSGFPLGTMSLFSSSLRWMSSRNFSCINLQIYFLSFVQNYHFP